MRDILAAEGFDTSHTSGGLFFSPFRAKERTPSFHIDDINHRWYDHGNAADSISGYAGGDVISFVRQLKGLDFLGALEYLCRYNPSIVPDIHVVPVVVPDKKDVIIGDAGAKSSLCEIVVRQARDAFADRSLIGYAEGVRRIGIRYLEAVCMEVHYDVVVTDTSTGETRSYGNAAIGFRNVGGGWALRYEPSRRGDKGKRSTGGGFSVVSASGENLLLDDLAVSSPSVVVFEGFMDYMSWLVLYRPSARPEDTDVVVLNSVSNLRQALPYILRHRNVVGILDDDEAGDKATGVLRDECGIAPSAVRFVDAREMVLRGHKDVNERLVVEAGD